MPIKMQLNTRPILKSFGLKTLTVAVASAVLLLSNAHAAGLGKLTVLSSLGQPLRAEIELNSVAKDEAGSLVVKLAPTDAFRLANIEFNPTLMSLRFAVDQRGGRQFIRVTSSQPVNEPFVDMLLELSSGSNRLVREYTFLLDPAELRTSQPAQVSAPVDVPALKSMQVQIQTPPPMVQPEAVAPSVMPSVEKTREKRFSPASDSINAGEAHDRVPGKAIGASKNTLSVSDYEVKRGDTLGRIAARVKPAGVSLDQMLVALYRTNPNAFIGNNMNRLRTGQILSVPDADAVSSVSNSEARGVVIAQASDFNAYRNKLAGQVAVAAPTKTAEPKQSAAGKITAKVEEKPTAVNESQDKLKLSQANAATAAAIAAGQKAAAAAAEDKIAKDKAIAEAAARVKELEKNVSELNKLLEIKNKGLAEKQKQVSDKAAADAAAMQAAAAAEAARATSLAAAAVKAEKAAKSGKITPEPLPTAPVVQAAKPVAATATPVPVTKPRKPVVKAAQAPVEKGFFESINPYVLYGGLLALLGLGGFGIYSARRNKNPQKSDSSILSDSSLQVNSLFGSTGGQSVDTNNSVFNSNFAPSASQLDTNEVDPVAEADVYIAYGRDAQAEEILKEALRTQPDRHAVRVKLLEIYANRKDTRSFEILAGELYGMTKGEGDDWAQAVNLGTILDPNNPLYAGGEVSDDVANASALSAATEPLGDLDPEELLGTLPDSDMDSLDFNDPKNSSTPQLSENQLADLDLDLGSSSEPASGDELDFDLGELSIPSSAEPVAKADQNEIAVESDADFDLGDLSVGQEHPSVKTPELSVQAEDDTPDLNFDLGLPGAVDEPVAAPVESADTVASEDNILDFDLGGMTFDEVAPKSPAPVEIKHELSAIDLDLPQLNDSVANPLAVEEVADTEQDLILQREPVASAFEPAPLEFGLGEINLDLGSSAASDFEQESDIALDLATDASLSSMEMDTKLDLAIAYQEIGDKEGARELIDEVIKGGSDEQVEKAKEIRRKLA